MRPARPSGVWSGRPDSNRRRPAWEAGGTCLRLLPSHTFRSLPENVLKLIYHGMPTSPVAAAERTAESWQNRVLERHWPQVLDTFAAWVSRYWPRRRNPSRRAVSKTAHSGKTTAKAQASARPSATRIEWRLWTSRSSGGRQRIIVDEAGRDKLEGPGCRREVRQADAGVLDPALELHGEDASAVRLPWKLAHEALPSCRSRIAPSVSSSIGERIKHASAPAAVLQILE